MRLSSERERKRRRHKELPSDLACRPASISPRRHTRRDTLGQHVSRVHAYTEMGLLLAKLNMLATYAARARERERSSGYAPSTAPPTAITSCRPPGGTEANTLFHGPGMHAPWFEPQATGPPTPPGTSSATCPARSSDGHGVAAVGKNKTVHLRAPPASETKTPHTFPRHAHTHLPAIRLPVLPRPTASRPSDRGRRARGRADLRRNEAAAGRRRGDRCRSATAAAAAAAAAGVAPRGRRGVASRRGSAVRGLAAQR